MFRSLPAVRPVCRGAQRSLARPRALLQLRLHQTPKNFTSRYERITFLTLPIAAWHTRPAPDLISRLITPQILRLQTSVFRNYNCNCNSNCHHSIQPTSTARTSANGPSLQPARPLLLIPPSQHVQNTCHRRNGRWGQCPSSGASPRQCHPPPLPCHPRARLQEADL